MVWLRCLEQKKHPFLCFYDVQTRGLGDSSNYIAFLGFGLIKNGIDFGTQPSIFLLLWNLHVCTIIFRASGHLWGKNYSFSCLRICCENVELLVSVGDFLVSVLVLKKTWHNYFWRDI